MLFAILLFAYPVPKILVTPLVYTLPQPIAIQMGILAAATICEASVFLGNFVVALSISAAPSIFFFFYLSLTCFIAFISFYSTFSV